MAEADTSAFRAVILTALPLEYRAVRAHLTNLREELHPQGTVYEQGIFTSLHASWEVGIVEIGAGNAGAAQEAERAISHFQPSVALFIGVAGGIKDVSLGDVVAATKIYGYESGKARKAFETRPDVGQSGYRLEQRARAEARKGDWVSRIEGGFREPPPRALVAPIAAGEAVIASQSAKLYSFLRKHYGDSVAVEMEGRGFLKATRANPGVEAIVVRGVSDLIDGKHEADAVGWQEIAARNASAFAFEVLAKLPANELGEVSRIVQADPQAVLSSTAGQKDARVEGCAIFPGRTPLILPSQNILFQGRDQILDELDGALTGHPRVALWGLPGVGKTQIALQYAHTRSARYEQVCWVVAESRSALAAGLAPLARQFGLTLGADADQGAIIAAVRGWLEGHENWLLVLDNVEDVVMASEVFPARSTGRILMTTLSSAVGSLAHPVAVEKLGPQDGAQFLLVRAKRLDPRDAFEVARPEDRESALAIAGELDGLCLALDQAGAFIEEMSSSPAEYLELYRSNGRELRRIRGDLGEKEHASVAITFSLAFAKVEAESLAAADLLRLCAFLSPDDIPEEILTAAADYIGQSLKAACSCPLSLIGTVRAATRFAVLRRDPAKKVLSVHRLVQEVIRDGMDAKVQEEWAVRAVTAAYAGFTEAKAPAWEVRERLVPQAMACVEHIAAFDMKFCMAWRLLAEAGVALAVAGDYENSEFFLRRAVAFEDDLGLHYWLALSYYRQGKYGEAETQLRYGFEMAEPESHQDCACWPRCSSLLAQSISKQGRYCEAEMLAKDALRESEARFGLEHRKTADYLFNVADLQATWLWESYGQHECIDFVCLGAFEPLVQRAVSIMEQHDAVCEKQSSLDNCLKRQLCDLEFLIGWCKGEHEMVQAIERKAREIEADGHDDGTRR